MSVIERTVSRPRHEKPSASAAGDVIVVEQLRMRYAAAEAVAGIDLRGHADRLTCSPGCRMSSHRRQAERAPVPEPWQAVARRLEPEYPERWGKAAPRVVVRDPGIW